MNRVVTILCAMVACELVAASALFAWLAVYPPPVPPPEPPRPDLSVLDAVTAGEIRDLQDRVQRDMAEDWHSLAKIYLMYGFFAEADLCFRRVVELNPKSFNTYFWWGTALHRLGRTTEAAQTFLAAIPLAQGLWVDICWYGIGLNLLREEKVIEAEKAFRTGGDFFPAEYELARILVRSGRAKEAVPMLDHLIAVQPETQNFYQLRARAALALGDLKAVTGFQERAERAADFLISEGITMSLNNQKPEYGLERQSQEGIDLLDSGRFAEAARSLQKVLAVEWSPNAADSLVQAELKLGHADNVIELLDEVIARYGPTPKRLVALGDAHQLKGEKEQARRSWERAARIRIDQQAHEKLAEHYNQIGNKEQSDRHRALAYHAEGLEAFRENKLESAADAIQKAVKLAPKQAHSWYYLGECHRFLDHTEPAQAAYRKCLEVNPNHGRARRSLERLAAW